MEDSATVQSSSSHSSLSSSSLSSPTAEDDSTKSTQDIAEEIASDFRNFLNFSVDREEMKFNDSVEMMLTKLDEYFSLVDMIRSDTTLCLANTIPDIDAKCSEMEAIFEKIDRLEAFVGTVRQNVSMMEEMVSKAEGELGTVGGLVKKLTSFVSLRRSSHTASVSKSKPVEFTPPSIFSTSDYFDPSLNQPSPGTASASPS